MYLCINFNNFILLIALKPQSKIQYHFSILHYDNEKLSVNRFIVVYAVDIKKHCQVVTPCGRIWACVCRWRLHGRIVSTDPAWRGRPSIYQPLIPSFNASRLSVCRSSQSHVSPSLQTCQCCPSKLVARGWRQPISLIEWADTTSGRYDPAWPSPGASTDGKISHSVRGRRCARTTSTWCYLERQLSLGIPQTHFWALSAMEWGLS